MSVSNIDTTSAWPSSQAREARGLSFSLQGTQGTWKPKLSDEEQAAAEAQPLSVRRQLSPKEQARLEFLQNQLQSLLQQLAENPSQKQKGRIREIEQEMEKLTGCSTGHSLTKLTARMPGQKDNDDDENQDTWPTNPETLDERIAAQTLPQSNTEPSLDPDALGPGALSQVLRATSAYLSGSLPALQNLPGKTLGKV